MSSANTIIRENGFGLIPGSDYFGRRKDYEIVKRYTLENEQKASVRLITWGARVQSIKIPNKNGVLNDVLLGYDDMEGYLKNRYVGGIIGRVVNEIANGTMTINGCTYQLSCNDENTTNHVNGGFVAFDNVNWESYILGKQVIMSHLSYNGNEGYPGFMLTQVKYSWTDRNELHINIRATTTKSTPVNITSYCLFNLAGHGMGPKELKKHVITVNADKWILRDVKNNLSVGYIHPVDYSIFDLRLPTQLNKKRLFRVPKGGYNNALCVSSPSRWCYRFHARILHPDSGRFLEVYSNHPGLQIYTCNDLPDKDDECSFNFWNEGSTEIDNVGKDGIFYRRHGAFVLSPQNYPNAINIKDFPSCILNPGQVYMHDITYKFGVCSEI